MASSLSAASWLLAGTTVNLMMAQIVLLDDLLHISVLSLKKHVVTKLGPEQLPSVLDTVHCTAFNRVRNWADSQTNMFAEVVTRKSLFGEDFCKGLEKYPPPQKKKKITTSMHFLLYRECFHKKINTLIFVQLLKILNYFFSPKQSLSRKAFF